MGWRIPLSWNQSLGCFAAVCEAMASFYCNSEFNRELFWGLPGSSLDDIGPSLFLGSITVMGGYTTKYVMAG